MVILKRSLMKTLVTHINPHLDDIVGIWLFRKYNPEFTNSLIEFISASREAGILSEQSESKDKIYVGTGGGRFDEHKEGLETCAGTLVYEWLKEKGLSPQDNITEKALQKLIKWNQLIDTGKAEIHQINEFSVPAFLRPLDGNPETSKKAVELGGEILDRILEVLKRNEQSLIDFEKRVEFETRFGKSIAVTSETIDRSFCKKQDGELFLMHDPKYNSYQFYSDTHDLEPIYQKVKELDPEASWFLHQSHHMVIRGSGSAPDSTPTKLSLEQLIEVAKSI